MKINQNKLGGYVNKLYLWTMGNDSHFKINKMKNLISKVSKLDKVDLVGAAFGMFVFLPLVLILIVDIATNGAKML